MIFILLISRKKSLEIPNSVILENTTKWFPPYGIRLRRYEIGNHIYIF